MGLDHGGLRPRGSNRNHDYWHDIHHRNSGNRIGERDDDEYYRRQQFRSGLDHGGLLPRGSNRNHDYRDLPTKLNITAPASATVSSSALSESSASSALSALSASSSLSASSESTPATATATA